MASKRGRPPGTYSTHRRLTELRELLERHPKGLSVIELSTRLKVTDRSIRRYLGELQRDVDVERSADSIRTGGTVVKIPTRDLPRRVKLHRTQIYGLLMARRVFRMLEGTTFERSLDLAVEALLSHVRRAPRRGAEIDPDTKLEERFLYLPASSSRPLTDAAAAEALDEVLDACAQLRVCRVKVRTHAGREGEGEGEVEALTVHPYAVVLHKESIYCVAYVRERDAIRTLRADRMLSAEALTLEHFVIPPDFDVDAHFAGELGVPSGESPVRVAIDFSARVAEGVRQRRYPGAEGRDALFEALADGGVRLVMQVADTPELRTWILGFGAAARVVEPPDLAQAMQLELSGALARYATPAARARTSGVPQAASIARLASTATKPAKRRGAARKSGA